MATAPSNTLKDAVRRKKAIQTEHFVPATDEDVERLKNAEQKLNLARFTSDDEEVAAAEASLAKVRAELRETGVSFVIRGIGRLAFEELVREHPPTKEQIEKNEASFDPETFWPALCAASVVGGMSAEEWKTEVFDSAEWGPGELTDLREKVMTVNTETRVALLGN